MSKKNINILIMSASRGVSLARRFKKALKGVGGKLIAVDNRLFSSAFFAVDNFNYVPRDTEKNFLEAIIKICKKYKISLIIPSRDEELTFFSKNKDEIKRKTGTDIMVATEKTIGICRDKLGFFKFCQKNGFGCPEIYTLADIKNRKIKFPLFLNGRLSKGSKNAFKVNNKKELLLYLKLIDKPIIEEYVGKKEYSVDLFADFDGNVISVVPRERIGVFGGECFIGKTFKNEIIISDCIKLAKKLGLIGMNTIQCFFDGKRTKFIEVNARYGGGIDLSLAAGADATKFLVELLRDKKIKPQIGKFKDGLVMLRYTDNFFIEEKKIKWPK